MSLLHRPRTGPPTYSDFREPKGLFSLEKVKEADTTNFITFIPTLFYFGFTNTVAVVASIVFDWSTILFHPFSTLVRLLFAPIVSGVLAGLGVFMFFGKFLGLNLLLDFISLKYYHGNTFVNWGTPNPLDAANIDLDQGLDNMLAELPQFDPPTAKTLLFFSALMYEGPIHTKLILDLLPLRKYTLNSTHILGIPDRSVLGNFAGIFEISKNDDTDERFLIVSFKGTSPFDLNQWLVDVSLAKTNAYKNLYGSIHQGFHQSMFESGPDDNTTLYLEVTSYINNFISSQKEKNEGVHYHLWVTGHSLGAALATLYFGRITATSDIRGAEVDGAYDFGCPRVGNLAFRNRFIETENSPYDNKVKMHRVYNVNDPVPMLPLGFDNPDVLAFQAQTDSPSDPLNYIHVGVPIDVHRNGFNNIPVVYPDFAVTSAKDIVIWAYQTVLVAFGVAHIVEWIADWAAFFDDYDTTDNCVWFDIAALLSGTGDHMPAVYLNNLERYEATHAKAAEAATTING